MIFYGYYLEFLLNLISKVTLTGQHHAESN